MKYWKCTWARTWKVPAGKAKINNRDLEKISPMRITVSCSAPTGPARLENSTTRPQAIQERASKRSNESVCEMVCRPTAATVAIAKWHDPQRASANDCYAPSFRTFPGSSAYPESSHSQVRPLHDHCDSKFAQQLAFANRPTSLREGQWPF